MLIVSKFHDYYDSAMAAGIDKSLVYKRVDEPGMRLYNVPRLPNCKEEWYTVDYRNPTSIKVTSYIVPLVFCGKLYMRAMATVRIERILVIGHGDDNVPVSSTYHHSSNNEEELWSKLRTTYKLDEARKQKVHGFKRWVDPNQISFEEWGKSRDWAVDHIQMNCPVFMVRYPTPEESLSINNHTNGVMFILQKNPMLKDLGFFQEKSPFQAFQEIAMYMGGVMGIESRPMVKLSDKEVHQKHGFDKWSFRKMSQQESGK